MAKKAWDEQVKADEEKKKEDERVNEEARRREEEAQRIEAEKRRDEDLRREQQVIKLPLELPIFEIPSPDFPLASKLAGLNLTNSTLLCIVDWLPKSPARLGPPRTLNETNFKSDSTETSQDTPTLLTNRQYDISMLVKQLMRHEKNVVLNSELSLELREIWLRKSMFE